MLQNYKPFQRLFQDIESCLLEKYLFSLIIFVYVLIRNILAKNRHQPTKNRIRFLKWYFSNKTAQNNMHTMYPSCVMTNCQTYNSKVENDI